MPELQTLYLESVLDLRKREKIICKIVNKLKYLKRDYAIACCGMSGMLVAPEIASRLNKHLWIVRKKSDKNHSCYKVEGVKVPLNYIIVDDLIMTGATIEYMQGAIKSNMNQAGKLNKIILYSSYHCGQTTKYYEKKFKCPILEV